MKRQKLMGALLALSASLGLAACEATTYGYVPVESAANTGDGQVAAEYSLPRSTPHGSIRVDSLGVTEAKESGAPNALHVRMTITNDDDKDWTVDTQKQQITINGQTLKASTVATDASAASGTNITVPAKSTRSVDLFFALPTAVSAAENLPSFDADWQVAVGDDTESGVTSFTRTVIEPEPEYDSSSDEYGYSSPYWYYPGYYDAGLSYWPPGYYYPYYYPYYAHHDHDHGDHGDHDHGNHDHAHSGYSHPGSTYYAHRTGGYHGGSYASRSAPNGYRSGGYRSGTSHGGAYQGGYHGGGAYHGGGGYHGGGAYHGGGGFHGGGAYHGGGGFHGGGASGGGFHGGGASGGGFHGGGFSGGGFHGGGSAGGGHGGGHR